jgi:hypothetical protein
VLFLSLAAIAYSSRSPSPARQSRRECSQLFLNRSYLVSELLELRLYGCILVVSSALRNWRTSPKEARERL